MRIISKFHDYYDGVMAYDQDRELIYDRKVEEVVYKDTTGWTEASKKAYPFPLCHAAYYRYFNEEFSVNQRIIGFCGRIYPSLMLKKRDVAGWTACNNIEEVDAFIKANFSEDYYQSFIKKDPWSRWGRGIVYGRRHRLKEWFDEVEAKKDSYRETLFEEKRCPVIVAWVTPGRWTVEYNANLKETGFVKLFEPWSAYQEISMFLGSLAAPHKPIPEIDDVTMAEIKGFNKHSFRKDPKR